MKGKYYYCLFWVIITMNPCPLLGQGSLKKQLTISDYEIWGDLKVNSISDNGKWSSYSMIYDNHKDTLFVQNNIEKKRYSFPKGRNGKFWNNEVFVYMLEDTMKIIDLKNHKKTTVVGVKQYETLNNGKILLNYNSNNCLELRNRIEEKIKSISEVTAYKISDTEKRIAYVKKKDAKYEVGYIELENNEQKIIVKGNSTYGRLSWQSNGKSFVFTNNETVYCYQLTNHRLYSFEINKIAGYEGATMASGGFTNLTISDDGEKVFFSIINPIKNSSTNNNQEVEIWNGNDTCLFPTKQLIQATDMPKLTVWFPTSGECNVISDNFNFNVRLTTQGDYVLLSNPYTYTLTSQYPKRVDYYIKNVKTGAVKLLLKQHPEEINQLSFSPFNNAILYFQNNNWWHYNPDTDIKTAIGKQSNHSWKTTEEEDTAHSGAYGVASWTADEKNVLLYDSFDIWKTALDGSTPIRLTKGREKSIIYRLSKLEFEAIKFRGYEGGIRKVISLTKDIILEVTNSLDWSTGFSVYNEKTGLRNLVYGQKRYSGIKRSKNEKYIFTSETFSQPPQLEWYNHQQLKIIFYSNRQQVQYNFGRSELVHYENSNGKKLKGALFYPAGYEEGKKYPMIVKVYEQLSSMLHKYVKPSLLNDTGFNTSIYTTNGYFVLFPDIKYNKGNPGISANDCVTSAVKQVIALQAIDEKRIGIIGHSFGGYETDFIITQTNLFSAAVSGAGIGNTIGSYFSLNRNGGGAEDSMWRFENQQLRMGIPFYEDKQAYLANSPLFNADKIKTPLLQWSGKNDIVVPYEQSINLYLALRKLRLKNCLLIYPNEGHSLSKETNQRDLTIRVLQWFDYYLKDKTQIDWITTGTTDK
jgi:dipeptidyl aminopeptidase/acylaminoacyl peptidase